MKNTILNIFSLYLDGRIDNSLMYSLLMSVQSDSDEGFLMLRFQKGDPSLWTIHEIMSTIYSKHKNNNKLLKESMSAALESPEGFMVL